MYNAYLVVLCDIETNAIINAEIWSSPEWSQSMCLPDVRVYVAWQVIHRNSFRSARDTMERYLKGDCRYSYLLPYLDKNRRNSVR